MNTSKCRVMNDGKISRRAYIALLGIVVLVLCNGLFGYLIVRSNRDADLPDPEATGAVDPDELPGPEPAEPGYGLADQRAGRPTR